MAMNWRQLIKLLKNDGWYLARRSPGSHDQYKHPTKKNTITISSHLLSDDVRPGTLKRILELAGIDEKGRPR